ncbi:MAG TPA: hypothetical protein PLB02_04490, partial [Thermoanaerobaculia bacterium]|nr:hypothetical protein [Thermoanaerobaculia bacterium]
MPPPPPEHRLVCGSFPALEPAFVAAVRALKAADPLRPVEVLVGSNLLAVYLRRRVAEALGAVANLRLLTFLDLAREIVPDDDARPPLPALGETLLAREALFAAAEGEAFGALRGRPSLAAALVSTANDLRDAGIPPEKARRLLPAASPLDDRKRHLTALAAVLAGFEESRRRFKDATSLLESAATAAIPSSDAPLLVYGLYDLGGLRESLLRNVARARPVHAFVPEDGAGEPPGLAPVRTALFRGILGVDARRLADPPLPDPAVTIAPSENAEAREVVREILRASDSGVPLHRIAILVRNPGEQEPPLVAELSLRGIPFFRPAGSGFAASPAGRALRLLFALAARGFPAEAFRELLDLLETLGRFPALGIGEATPARLGAALASLSVPEGVETLEAALAGARERLERPFPAADDPDGWFAARRAREKTELQLLAKALTEVRALLPEVSSASWPEWARRLRRTADLLLAGATDRERLERGFEAIEALGRVEARAAIEASTVEPLLEAAIDLSPEIRGRFERDGVALLSAVSARGLLFDLVLVPGLVEQSFPRPARPDPLLFDEERSRLADAAKAPVVPRTGERHGREERFLFSLARASARQRLVLLAAARDVATDRPRLLSPFLLDLLPDGARRALLRRELGE